MGENTEYRVNFPVTLLHIYWVCQYKLFLISEGWERFTEPSKPSLEYNWSDNPTAILYLVVLNQISDFGFKYFLEIICTKITL